MTTDKRAVRDFPKNSAQTASCPRWLWRSLLMWIPQPVLLEAITANCCCMQHFGTRRALCDCDRWPLCFNTEKKPSSAWNSRRQAEEGQLVHYTIFEASPADIFPSAAIERSKEAAEVPPKAPTPELSLCTGRTRSRDASPGQFGVSAHQKSPRARPGAFAPSQYTTQMNVPQKALLYEETLQKSPRLPPPCGVCEEQKEMEEKWTVSPPSIGLASLFHSVNTTTDKAVSPRLYRGHISSMVCGNPLVSWRCTNNLLNMPLNKLQTAPVV